MAFLMPFVLARAVKVKMRYMTRLWRLRRHVEHCRASALDMSQWEYQVFSQNGEDGVLAVIMDRIGVGPRKFIEFGFGPTQNNTLAVALQKRFSGLYLDSSERSCEIARRMMPLISNQNITVTCVWIDETNIDRMIVAGIGIGEVDVLSVDVDGNDYWLWRAIKSVEPRVVIVEYNASFGPERAVTVPYDGHFDRHRKHPSGLYHGMSLRAAAELGGQKGYALVGCEKAGLNAFFVRRDLLAGLCELSVERAYQQNQNRLGRGLSQREQEAIVYSLPVVQV